MASVLAILVLGLGRPGIGIPQGPVSERECDPVEGQESESEEEVAFHCRCETRRRVFEHVLPMAARMAIRIATDSPSLRAVEPWTRSSPHDFDLRNGLGAALRC